MSLPARWRRLCSIPSVTSAEVTSYPRRGRTVGDTGCTRGRKMQTSHLIADLVTYLFDGVIIFVFVAGWTRWARHSQPRNVFSYLALIGFSLATVSLIIAVATLLYARKIGGFPYGDPLLFRIFPWGGYSSSGALLFAVAGVWRSSPLRWHALALSLGTVFFWFSAAIAE
jgi:hypothetical protein